MNNSDNQKPKKLDTLSTGIITGILIPIVFYFIMYFSKVQDVRYTLFSNNQLVGNIVPLILSHCILPNLVLFFIFNGLNWMKATKGVLGSTLVLTVLIFLTKLIFSVI